MHAPYLFHAVGLGLDLKHRLTKPSSLCSDSDLSLTSTFMYDSVSCYHSETAHSILQNREDFDKLTRPGLSFPPSCALGCDRVAGLLDVERVLESSELSYWG